MHQHSGGMWAAWTLWGMLFAGAGLILASLWRSSERFWYWKQARQMAAGEVAPAAESLRIGQRFHLLRNANQKASDAPFLSTEIQSATDVDFDTDVAAAMTGRIVGSARGLLTLLLESDARTREDEEAQHQSHLLRIGQSLTVQITGDSELFRFTGVVRRVCADPEQPHCTQITVKLPFWLARIQRRQHVRAPLRSGVTLRMTDQNGAGKISVQPLRGTLQDLSASGLCMKINGAQRPDTLARLCEQWRRGATLECNLNTPLLRETPLRLRVHSCERIVVPGGLSLQIRGEFMTLPAWQQETIVSLVFQAQRQNLRQQSPRFQTVA